MWEMKYAGAFIGCNRSASGRAAAHLKAWQRLLHLWVPDELRRPIDKEVFMRMLSYYEIRSQTERPSGAPTKMNAAQSTVAAHRRMP
jgi:hypothetical protein